MRRIKLWWYRRLLSRAYHRLVWLGDGADCGHSLLKYISPEYAAQSAKVDGLFEKCKAIDGGS